jgi:hypothetical protein
MPYEKSLTCRRRFGANLVRPDAVHGVDAASAHDARHLSEASR